MASTYSTMARVPAVHFTESWQSAMGSTAHVIVATRPLPTGDTNSALATALLEAAHAEIVDAEHRLSRFRDDSELSLVNRAPGVPVRVSDATFALVETALRARHETDGAFDPLLGQALIRAGYDRDFAVIGTEGRPDRSFPVPCSNASPGSRVQIDHIARTIAVSAGTALDLGGIAKGATADAVAAVLMARGAAGCSVSIGGDVRVCGVGPDEGVWRIDLACPGADDDQRRRSVRLSDGGVCTSSTTRRRWQRQDDNGEAHHLIDPTTGRSREDGPQTVTVVAASATAAEVIAKWIFAGGEASAFESTGVVVETSGRVVELPGFERFAADGYGVCASAPTCGRSGPG